MKLNAILAALTAVVLINLPDASAAIVLSDFESFETSGAYDSPFFRETWDGQGIQNLDGTYDFGGNSTNASASGVDVFFSEPADFTGQEFLAVSAKLLAENESSSFIIQLFDINGLSAIATFDTSFFSVVNYTTVVVQFVFDLGFDLTGVEQWTLSGGIPFGEERFGVSFESATAIPEPHSLALAGLATLVAVWWRRRRPLSA